MWWYILRDFTIATLIFLSMFSALDAEACGTTPTEEPKPVTWPEEAP